ncbi:MAG: SDR family NAD(P)-dependent oxidoreductase [Gammaproteobacteria bacterium]|nr:SDR family NAD(P)-dependent oxidoreductase [Gammaproteobacteria bacterium]
MSLSPASVKHIWITGAGSGIGKALALQYAAQGHQVIISGRALDKLEQVADQASAMSGRIIPLAFDVTATDSVEHTSAQLSELVPHLNLVILNAGTCEYIKKGHLDPALFGRVFDTNVFGMINSINAALPLLQNAPHRPLLAGVCSLAAFIGFPRAEAYGASKAAARYLLHSVRTDYHHLMDVTVINPGFVTTPMTAANDFPMPFEMSADDAARRIGRALEKRPLEFNFPRRLTAVLRLAQLFKGLWYKRISRKPDASQRERRAE